MFVELVIHFQHAKIGNKAHSLRFGGAEDRHASDGGQFHVPIHRFEPRSEAGGGLERRGAVAHRRVEPLDDEIRPTVLFHHGETAAERAAGSEHAERLAIGRLLVGKGVEAVERQHHIKTSVRKRQIPHIALHKINLRERHFLRPPLRPRHHVRRIVQARDLGIGKRLVERHREDAGAHGNLQKTAGKAVGNRGKRQLLIEAGLFLVQTPDQPADERAEKGGAGNHVVVERRLSAHVFIGLLNGRVSAHGSSFNPAQTYTSPLATGLQSSEVNCKF